LIILGKKSIVWALLFLFQVPGAHAEEGPRPGRMVLTPHPLNGTIDLDGRLDEAAWREAGSLAELVQQSPRPGEPTPYKTSVIALVAADKLYIAFKCTDPDPSQIAVHTLQRDGNVNGDDTVAVVLDTYGDGRTGYYFRVNSAGARVDGLVAGSGEPSTDWDGIWNGRTSQTVGGWTAEFVIPSRTLSFTRGSKTWGLNLERSVARDRTVLRWASPTLDSSFYDLSRSGALAGVGHFTQGLGLDISPYGAARTEKSFQEHQRDSSGDAGVDVRYRISPQLAAVLTVNTDFAETEVDSRQLNLTRFPLFFPERRSFFLEGSNQFVFGLDLGRSFIPFFSRSVGLYGGQKIPINVGLKLNGRINRWNMAILDVQTRDTEFAPGTNLFAGRLSYDLTSKLRLGTTLTNGDPSGVRKNSLVGFDAVWRTSSFLEDKNLHVGAWAAGTSGDIPPGDRAGWGFKLGYPNDLWDCFASFNKFGEAMIPALGFLPRPGTRRWDLSCEFKPRPSKDGPFRWIRQNFMEHQFYRVTNHEGVVESWRFFWAPVNMRLESGDRFELNWIPWYEYLPEAFEIAEGVILPVGGYRFDRFRLEFESSRHRPWEFGTTTWFGTFYNGHLLQQENYFRFTSRRGTWQAGVSAEHNFGDLGQGTFVQRLWQLNLSYAFSPDIVITSFLQYDTESKNIGNNVRLRWTFSPGNDLFVVWNRAWHRLILSSNDVSILPQREILAVKLRWTFRR